MSAIPRIFHRIWIGADSGDPIPSRFEAYWLLLRTMHPGWDFHTWTTVPLNLQCREAFDAATTHAGRSDVLRYEILAKRGGVYVDTDVEPLRPFDDLLKEDTPFVGWEDTNLLCPTVMGSPPGHPAIMALLDALPAWSAARPGAPPNQQTGPYFLTAQWKDRADVRRLPPVAFYPVGWWEKHRLGMPYPPEAYAVHHWAAQWLGPGGPPQKAHVGAG